ncbi:MAG: flagellar hook capping FlgD N-terminal domain-containing protein [Clostridiaceae bacterium]|nr:hypothetical protein [Eubacteriales bacterium]
MDSVLPTTNTQSLRTLEDLASEKRSVKKELGQDQFMELLVQQMANQDPLSPTSDTDFIAQLAQFSMLNSINAMSSSMAESQMYNLVGKDVYIYADTSHTKIGGFGTVEGVVKLSGKNYLLVDGVAFELSDIAGVKYTEEAPNAAAESQSVVGSTGLLNKTVTATLTVDGETQEVSGVVVKLSTKDGMAYATIRNAETGDTEVAVSSIEEIYS